MAFDVTGTVAIVTEAVIDVDGEQVVP